MNQDEINKPLTKPYGHALGAWKAREPEMLVERRGIVSRRIDGERRDLPHQRVKHRADFVEGQTVAAAFHTPHGPG